MNILIVEDDRDKSNAIKCFFEKNYTCESIEVKESITSGLYEVITNDIYNLSLIHI
mgnify:FL=1